MLVHYSESVYCVQLTQTMLVRANFQLLSIMARFLRQHVWLLRISTLCHSCRQSLEYTPLNSSSTVIHWKVWRAICCLHRLETSNAIQCRAVRVIRFHDVSPSLHRGVLMNFSDIWYAQPAVLCLPPRLVLPLKLKSMRPLTQNQHFNCCTNLVLQQHVST